MWVPYSLAARLLVREVSLEGRIFVAHAPELAFFAVRGRRRGRMGRPEENWARRLAMTLLGIGLSDANHHADALIVKEAELSMLRRVGAPEEDILGAQGNLANTYCRLGRLEEALPLRRDVYSGRLKLNGEEHGDTLGAALNFAGTLIELQHFEEAKALMRKTLPVARRVLGENDRLTLKMKNVYAVALYKDPAATLDDLREAVTTLEEIYGTARRVFGGAHPLVTGIEAALREARAALGSRETPSSRGI